MEVVKINALKHVPTVKSSVYVHAKRQENTKYLHNSVLLFKLWLNDKCFHHMQFLVHITLHCAPVLIVIWIFNWVFLSFWLDNNSMTSPTNVWVTDWLTDIFYLIIRQRCQLSTFVTGFTDLFFPQKHLATNLITFCTNRSNSPHKRVSSIVLLARGQALHLQVHLSMPLIQLTTL